MSVGEAAEHIHHERILDL